MNVWKSGYSLRPLARKALRPHGRFYSDLVSSDAGLRAAAMAASLPANEDVSLATKLAHAGITDVHNAPMAPPIHLATTYTRPVDGEYLDTDVIYARYDNPTRVALEKNVFELETHGIDPALKTEPSTYAFASGLMAATSVLLAHKSPLTVILNEDVYHGVTQLVTEVFGRHNVTVARADMTNPQNVFDQVALANPDHDVIVWMETPSNPKIEVIDIASICEGLQKVASHKVTTLVDATMASPVVTRPLELGADMVMHSGTKYIGGHSDALLGLVTTSPVTPRGQELTPIMVGVLRYSGGVASAFDSWLALRGLRTLQVRVQQQSKTALKLAEYFEQHEFVKKVSYPGLPSHPQHEIAKKQMSTFGGVMSVELEDEPHAMAFAAALETIKRATSLGGTETLIEHRASIEPPERKTSPPGLLRISVGIENEEDLIRDVDRALKIAEEVMKA